MIDSDLADSDLGTRGGVHLIERKRERRGSRAGRSKREEIAGRSVILVRSGEAKTAGRGRER